MTIRSSPEPRGLFGGGVGADAGVDGDDEPHAFCCGVGDARLAHAVALTDPVWDVITDVRRHAERRSGALEAVFSRTVATVPSTS